MWLGTLVKSCAKSDVASVLELDPEDRAWTPQPDHVNRIVREMRKISRRCIALGQTHVTSATSTQATGVIGSLGVAPHST